MTNPQAANRKVTPLCFTHTYEKSLDEKKDKKSH